MASHPPCRTLGLSAIPLYRQVVHGRSALPSTRCSFSTHIQLDLRTRRCRSSVRQMIGRSTRVNVQMGLSRPPRKTVRISLMCTISITGMTRLHSPMRIIRRAASATQARTCLNAERSSTTCFQRVRRGARRIPMLLSSALSLRHLRLQCRLQGRLQVRLQGRLQGRPRQGHLRLQGRQGHKGYNRSLRPEILT